MKLIGKLMLWRKLQCCCSTVKPSPRSSSLLYGKFFLLRITPSSRSSFCCIKKSLTRQTQGENFLPETTLICQNLRNILQSPTEYIRGSSDITISYKIAWGRAYWMVPSVLANLEHRHAFVRWNAILAIAAIYKPPWGEHLLTDAPEVIEKYLSQEEDLPTRQNAFLTLFNCAQDRAVSYLLNHLDSVPAVMGRYTSDGGSWAHPEGVQNKPRREGEIFQDRHFFVEFAFDSGNVWVRRRSCVSIVCPYSCSGAQSFTERGHGWDDYGHIAGSYLPKSRNP